MNQSDCKAYKACERINPDHPEKVAEKIEEMMGALKLIIYQNGWLYQEDLDLIKKLLSDMEG